MRWGNEVIRHWILDNSFCMEVEFELVETKVRMWATFVYAGIKDRTRAEQWQDLLMKSM